MSVGAMTTDVTRAAAALQADGADGGQGLPGEIVDGTGRRYELRVDPATGQPTYVHEATVTDEAGNRQDLRITLAPRADGSVRRTIDQAVTMASGDSRVEQTVQELRVDGTLASERSSTTVRQGDQLRESVTTASFDAAGQLVHQVADITNVASLLDAATGEETTRTVHVVGTWDNGGQPVPDDLVPTIERTETEAVRSPGQGIHTDTDRHLTYTAQASGTTEQLQWQSPATLTVRFDGHGDQYIERELAVPLSAEGTPDFNAAEEVRSVDNQSLVNKAALQVRIWGGLASNLAWFGGIMTGLGTPIGRGLMVASTAAGAAQFAGEVHAVATKRNDGDVWRVASAGYDTLMGGLLLVAMRGSGSRSNVLSALSTPVGRGAAIAAGAGGVAMNARELLGGTGPQMPGRTMLEDALRGAGGTLGSPLERPVGLASDLVGTLPADALLAR